MTQRDRLEATRRKRRGQAIVEGTGPSAKVERDYLRSLEKVRAEMLKQAKDELYPLIRSIERHEVVQDGFLSAVASVLLGISTRVTNLIGRWSESNIPAIYATDFVRKADEVSNHSFSSGFDKAVGHPPPPSPTPESFVAAKIQENVSLIKTIPERYFRDIEKAVSRRVSEEIDEAELVQALKDIFEQSEHNAKRIARDQTSKITSAINERRYRAAGVTSYIWRTQEDERVRKAHADRNGKEFSIDSEPLPGHEINCRCIMAGVVTSKR